MGIFKSTKTRNIVIYILCAIVVAISIAAVCTALWPKEEKAPELPKTTSYESPNTNTEGHYREVSCEELAAITGQSCDNTTEMPTPPAYAPSYTTPEPTQTPTTPQYNVPSVEPTPTYAPSCADYHAQYYAEFNTKLHEINTRYTNAINSAASNCHSFGGCPQKTKLEHQWQYEASLLKNSYKTNMTSVGCDSSQYVDF